jgi:hypothetical protein
VTRRRAIRLSLVALLCLLLGAATTVGVAWCIVLAADRAKLREPALQEFGFVKQSSLVGFAPELVGRGIDWRMYRVTPLGTRRFSPRLRAGWPFLATRSEYEDLILSEPWRYVSWTAGVSAPVFCCDLHYYLPVNPLWPGFALDTALYAAAWWPLLFTPLSLYRTARRRFRVSRGMCGACGYNLAGSPGGACPECGARA